MRGGAIAAFAWAGLLAVLAIVHAIWTHGGGIEKYEWSFAVLVVLGLGAAIVAFSRDALRRGPPGPDRAPAVLPDLSYGALALGLGVWLIAFGQVFGNALTFVGFAVTALAVGRLVAETRAMRRARRAHSEARRP